MATPGTTEQNNGNTDRFGHVLHHLPLCTPFSRFTDALVYAVMGEFKRYLLKL